jgi:hypothetical protein
MMVLSFGNDETTQGERCLRRAQRQNVGQYAAQETTVLNQQNLIRQMKMNWQEKAAGGEGVLREGRPQQRRTFVR